MSQFEFKGILERFDRLISEVRSELQSYPIIQRDWFISSGAKAKPVQTICARFRLLDHDGIPSSTAKDVPEIQIAPPRSAVVMKKVV